MADQLSDARGFIVAAPSSGSGKTTVTLGLIGALNRLGHTVATAKVGPDYIDPKFLEAAGSGRCINLDPWAMSPEQIRARLADHATGADVVVVEGVMGLFDGAEGGGGATADLAALLELPIVLVVDASRQAQSIAALVHGFTTFRTDIQVAATIATRVGSDRHAAMIASALAPLPIPHLGSVRTTPELTIRSRHLGLVQACEQQELQQLLTAASKAATESIDINQLQSLGFEIRAAEPPRNLPPLGQRIAVASDEAFGFVYPHIVSDWREQGAEIRFFSPLADRGPSPEVDAIFLPGGYPELHAGQLSNAHVFRDGMRTAAQTGCAIYGECGGYMVLGEALIDEHGAAHAMLGLLSHTTSFEKRERKLGYRKLKRIANARLPQTLYGHEFHYSTVAERGHDNPLFETADSKDQSLGKVGGARANVCGSYMHIIEAGSAS